MRLHQLALSGDPGPVTMHVLDLPGVSRGASSLLTRPPGLPAPTRDIEVSAVTIAGWAEAEGVQRIDLMWLDMEGMELAALKAAGPVLGTVRAVCMEVSREQSRPGAPCYPEVVSWMRAQGFQPVIDRVSLWFGNILFARPGARTRLRRGQEW